MRYVECDQQGVVFNSHYLTWADEAATAWWASIGLPWNDLIAYGGEAMVRASTIEWTAPARWGDTVIVYGEMARLGRTSLTLRFNVRVGDHHCCGVEMTYVWVNPHGAAPWPEDVRRVLGSAG